MSRLRKSTQLMALVLVNLGFIELLKTGVICPFFYCYGCPLAATACPIGTFQSFAALGQFPFYAIGSLGLFALVLGRFWCGWGCPFGTVQDVVSWVRRRGDFVTLRPVSWISLVVLAGALLAAWLATDDLFCKICPAGSLFAAIPHRFVSPDLTFGTFFYVHIATLAVALVLFYLVGRFWCRYLCPLGGIFGVFNRISLLKIRLNESECDNCDKCMAVCPVNIKRPEDVEKSNSCIRCGKCVDACPAKALRISASLRR